MASPVEASLEFPRESALHPYTEGVRELRLRSGLDLSGAGADNGPLLEEFGDVRRHDVPFELDRELAALCRERGPLRAVLARIADRLVLLRAWERIGYARLSDYATERLGLSARSVRSLAQVGARLGVCPRLEEALVSGRLAWTKVRLLARLSRDEDEATWISRAARVTAEELSREVRSVDRGSVEAGSAEDEGTSSRLFEVRCRPEVRWKWHVARGAAARAAGRMLHVSEAAELIAAEVLSAVPIEEHADEEPCEEAGLSSSREGEQHGGAAGSGGMGRSEFSETGPDDPAGAHPDISSPRRSDEPLLDGLEGADAFVLDERFHRALSMEQRLDARIGPLLVLVWERQVHRALGYTTREAYARERLGMDPTRARALVRLERAVVLNEPFARAYRTGALSRVKAGVLAPLVRADSVGWFVEDWVTWAARVTVRRLREDVERALAVSETDPEAFRRGGGLPPEARDDREIGAIRRVGEGHLVEATPAAEGDGSGPGTSGSDSRASDADGDREIGAIRRVPEGHLAENCTVRFFGPPDVVRLFWAVLCTVRRRMERDDDRLPAAGEALEAMLDHVLSSWGALDGKLAARHKVFARDGWRCAVPGCTSMQNLQDHHIRFRSAGGSDAMDNRTTLCAFHHLRGVHAGLLRCAGRAPDGLRWEMGIRPGGTPLLAYRSGDVRVSAGGPQS